MSDFTPKKRPTDLSPSSHPLVVKPYGVDDTGAFSLTADEAGEIATDIRQRIWHNFAGEVAVKGSPFGNFSQSTRLMSAHRALQAKARDQLTELAAIFDDIARGLRANQKAYLENEDSTRAGFPDYHKNHRLSDAQRTALDASLRLDITNKPAK